MPNKKNKSGSRRSHSSSKSSSSSKSRSSSSPHKRQSSSSSPRSYSHSSSRSSQFDDMTKQELYERARRANVEGRSGMSKEQLMNALRRG